MSSTPTITVRFRLDREDERRAYELLQARGKAEYGSLSQATITAVNGFFDRKDRLADDPYLETREKEDAFLARVLETVEKGMQTNTLGNLAALMQGVMERQPLVSSTTASEETNADLDSALASIMTGF